ncbi:hypothetical protein ACFSTC_16675 [Nonomuraea ferruginea]
MLITDARCYSATDIFAAGFQDHGIGPVLGVDDNTGAGGANVWTHELLKLLLELPSPAPGSPYRPLPGGAGMRVSVRRTLRVHELAEHARRGPRRTARPPPPPDPPGHPGLATRTCSTARASSSRPFRPAAWTCASRGRRTS